MKKQIFFMIIAGLFSTAYPMDWRKEKENPEAAPEAARELFSLGYRKNQIEPSRKPEAKEWSHFKMGNQQVRISHKPEATEKKPWGSYTSKKPQGNFSNPPAYLAKRKEEMELKKSKEELKRSYDSQGEPDAENYRSITIQYAAGMGYLKTVQEWLKNDPRSIKKTDKFGQTALHWGASKGHEGIVEELLNVTLGARAEIDAINKKGWTPFMMAAQHGHIKVITLLFNRMAEVDKKDKEGKTAFQFAMGNEHLGCAKLIAACQLSAFNVNETDDKGRTALHWAAAKGDLEPVQYLVIDCGAKVHPKDNDGIMPIHRAVEHGKFGGAKMLLEQDETILHEKTEDTGSTLLHWAASSTTLGADKFAQVLIEKGIDVNAQDNAGKTPLHYTGTVQMAQVLLNASAQINALDFEGNTLLHFAAAYGNFDLVKFLLENGVDANIQETIKNRSALQGLIRMHEGAKIKNGEPIKHLTICKIAQLLIDHDADPTLVDNFNHDASYYINDVIYFSDPQQRDELLDILKKK